MNLVAVLISHELDDGYFLRLDDAEELAADDQSVVGGSVGGREFLDGMAGAQTDLSTVDEAAQTLQFNLAALESWRGGKPVEIGAAKS